MTEHSMAHPSIDEFERRYSLSSRDRCAQLGLAADESRCTQHGIHTHLTIKNPRTLIDLMEWGKRDLFEFKAA